MWGIIPAAGAGSRIQPLAFSKELLPVGSAFADGRERPRAVSEYLVERLVLAGANRLCFVIAPGKTDILEYYGARLWGADIAYVVQPSPRGLCDALFCAAPLIAQDDQVVLGLPDTIWTPRDALCALPDGMLSLLLFQVERPWLFDAVVTEPGGRVSEVQVKQADVSSDWVWGAVKMPGKTFHALRNLWQTEDRRDEYLGTLLNAWIASGEEVRGIRAGKEYVDVGTLDGYRHAMQMLTRDPSNEDQHTNHAEGGKHELDNRAA
jgi:glucose-1-phosphate thymidylyltransferase